MTALVARRLLFLAGLGLLIGSTTACVPLRRHQDVLGELGRATKINGDLATKLKQAEVDLARLDSGEDIVKANYDALQDKYDRLLSENEALLAENERLKQAVVDGSPLGFRPEDFNQAGMSVTERGELILDSGVLFSPGRSTLRSSARSALDAITSVIKDRHPNRIIYIEGHTDQTPIRKSGNKDNWDLGFKRAHSVFQYLSQKGLTKEHFRLYSAGYAEPAEGADPKTQEGQKLCRRVVIRLGGPSQG